MKSGLRAITRQVGRVVAIFTGEVVSVHTARRLTRDLDAVVHQFLEAPLQGDWASLFLDGVSLRVRRPGGRKRVQMLVVQGWGIMKAGRRQLLAFFAQPGRDKAIEKDC